MITFTKVLYSGPLQNCHANMESCFLGASQQLKALQSRPPSFSSRRVKPIAALRKHKGSGVQSIPNPKNAGEVSQSVAPTPKAAPNSIPQRSLFAGGIALFLGVAAVALWNSQHWRLPWQRKRRKMPLLPEETSKQVPQVPEDLALIVDDLPPPKLELEEAAAEVERLRAARAALEQRIKQLDSLAKDMVGGIPTPFIPTDERPWRSGPATDALKDAIDASRLHADPTADVSYIDDYWGGSLAEQEAERQQKDVADGAEEPASRSAKAAPGTASALPALSQAPPTEEEAVLPKASDLLWKEEEVSADNLRREPQAPTGADPSTSARASDVSAAPAEDQRSGLLPGLSQEADREYEGDLLPKTSNLNFKEEIATPEEVEAVREDVAPVEARHVRRSQTPVPRVAGQLRLVAAGACIAAPAKLASGKGGEDAFFVSETLWGAVGVADGVGSWSLDGIDPSLYSRRLLEVAAAATEHGWGRRPGQGVRGLLHIAQTGTMDVAGTSTACIAQMIPGRTLQVANLGDSGFRVFRDGECLFGSEVQQHSFNCPYQAGSPKMHPMCNTASDANVYEIDLQEHDLVLLATDGVFDNLWDNELAALIRSYTEGRSSAELESHDAEALASLIVEAGHARGLDPRARTPWIVEAAKHQPDLLPWPLRFRPRGGKPDDCTAVVALMRADDNQY